jgi:DNA primase
MARIPEHEIEQLKVEVPVLQLAEQMGVELKQHGDEYLGLCPFHDDKNPSLVINPSKNLWHCLGACQSGGSVIDWVMHAEGVSFRHAVELLRNGSKVAAKKGDIVKRAKVPKLETAVTSDGDAQKQLKQVIEYYHKTLKESPEALEYLERRGLKNSEMIDQFQLGFSNRTLGYHLPFKCRTEGAG